jgi:demethylmenaquinone methyltransferase/2-methoxy-6-polyprenyl-1,4-benzoquinol methylase
MRTGHRVYFEKVVPRIGGLLSDGAAYRYLPRSVAYLPPTGDTLNRLRAAGFGTVERRLLSGGIAQLITATRRVETAAERASRSIQVAP